MKGLKIKIQALLLCGVLITGLFSSCASDENIDNGNKVNAGDKVLTLTLNTPKATTTSGAKTRATNMTQTDIGTKENQINLLTIGIFKVNGDGTTTVRTIQELPSGTGTNKFSTDASTGNSTATLVTNSLAAGDEVLVAANAPTGTFNGCMTEAEFMSKGIIAIDAALATPATTPNNNQEAIDNIPMFSAAAGTIVAPTSPATTYTTASNIALQHQLAKITVGKIKVDFPQSGPYKSATFQPTSFFLINVPNDLIFNKDAWTTAATSYWQGCSKDPSAADYKKYLGTDIFTTPYSALKYSTNDAENSITPNSVFYTIPNYSDANNTKLVIGGEFNPDPSNASNHATTVYYPVNINWVYTAATKSSAPAQSGTVAKKVYPNRNYTCNIFIKTKGADSPNTTIDPEDVSVTVTVTGFSDVSQDTTFE